MAMTINDPAIGTRKLTDEELTDLIGTPEEFLRDMDEFACTMRLLASFAVREKFTGCCVAAHRARVVATADSEEGVERAISALGLPREHVYVRQMPIGAK